MTQVNYITSLEELDLAMQEKLTGLVLNGNPVPVMYYSPDIEITQREESGESTEQGYYPVIIFYRQSAMPDFTRWSEDEIIDNLQYDTDGTLKYVDVRRHPEPWNVYYSVRLIAEQQFDMVKMKQFFHRAFPLRYSYLEIGGNKYDVFHVSQNIIGGGHKDFGRMKNGEREFAEVYLLKVEINLEIHDRETKAVATEVGIRNDVQNP